MYGLGTVSYNHVQLAGFTYGAGTAGGITGQTGGGVGYGWCKVGCCRIGLATGLIGVRDCKLQ